MAVPQAKPKLKTGWTLEMRTKLKQAAKHDDFTPQGELHAAHNHAVSEAEAFARCENKLRQEEQRLEALKREIGYSQLLAEVSAVSNELREAQQVRYSAMALLDQSLEMQWKVDMEEQSVAARLKQADDEAKWALSLQEHHDKQNFNLADTLQRARSDKQMAYEDRKQADLEMNAARDTTEALSKGREELRLLRRRLQNEKRRCQAAREETEILKDELREEIAARRRIEDSVTAECNSLRAQLRDALIDRPPVAAASTSAPATPSPDSLKAQRSKASAERRSRQRSTSDSRRVDGGRKNASKPTKGKT